MTFGEMIKNARFVKGLTLEQASKIVGITSVQLNNIELGKSKPSARTFSKLVSGLDLDENKAFMLLNEK